MTTTTGDLLRRPAWSGWSSAILITASVALGLDVAAHAGAPFAADAWWNDALAADRTEFLTTLSLVLNFLGGGLGTVIFGLIVVPVLVIIRRPRAAVFLIVAGIASASAVQVLKKLIGRPRPPDMVVPSDFGSYPSGHVANAATVAIILIVLFPLAWVWVSGAAWVLLMAFSRTYLHEHWLTDTIGGAMLGAGVALAAAVAFAPSFESDRRDELERRGDLAGLGWTP